MTQEEKLQEAKRLYKTANSDQRYVLESLFPELAESEDERIRKEITELVMQPTWKTEKEFHRRKELCAWLEKQESVEEIVERCKISWYNEGKIAGMAEGLTDDEKYQQGWHDALEKQGEKEHKIQPKFKIGDIIRFKGNETLNGEAETHKIVSYDNELYVFADGTTDLFCEQDLYELVEQKPTNKVKPKFEVGDWVINRTDAIIMQIVNNKDFYESVEIGGQRRTDTYNYVEWDFRLWSIKDAKDGDVLASKDKLSILIFRNFYTSTSFSSYYNIAGQGELGWSNDCFIPATKEQRDLLFAKMQEAGYEWDAEKKEVKLLITNGGDFDTENCEQKPQRMVSAKAKEALYDKPAWSEEDTSLCIRIQGILSICKSNSLLSPDLCKEMCDWLKSIKDRVQPKQEWSENDERMLEEVKFNFENNKEQMTPALMECYEKFFDKIKHLIPQNDKQEVSEEDETAIDVLINLVKMPYGNYIDFSAKNRLLNWLIALKGRITQCRE